MATSPPSLDHLILFLPLDPSTKSPLIPDSLSKSFTLTPGGKHADNLTSNTLILLADGCYIELISFLSEDISSHWWAPASSRPGWTDWCLTTSSSADESFTANLKEAGSHVEPRKGGRKRPDGVDVKWAVTFPDGENGGQDKRGLIPFFCHDDPIEARHLRVPLSEEKTTHPSRALGVLSLTVLVDTLEKFQDTRKIYEGIFGNKGVSVGDEQRVFQVGRVNEVEGLGGRKGRVILRVAREEEEKERVKSKGFSFGDVVLGAKASDAGDVGKRERVDAQDGAGLGGIWVEYV